MNQDGYSFAELIELERQLVLDAPATHGAVYDTSLALVRLFNNFIGSIDDPSKFLFVAFHGQMKKHLILGLLSAVRRHHVQAGMNYRQVLEAGAWAAYAMAHSDPGRFAVSNPTGTLDFPKRLKKARNDWLDTNYPSVSAEILRIKNLFDEDSAHANVLTASHSFQMREADDPGFDTPFFDREHTTTMRADIWIAGNIVMGMIDLFRKINDKEKVFRFNDATAAELNQRVMESQQQRSAMKPPTP